MSKGELLSVIIPVHNRHRLFIKCLVSVLKQSYSPIEIIIVDDKSDPSIKSYLDKHNPQYFKKIKHVRNMTNQGPSFSRNVGLKIAKGDYISFLDSDDVWNTCFAEELINQIEKSGNSVAICNINPVFVGNHTLSSRIFYSLLNLSRKICFYLMSILNNGKLDKSFFYMTRLSGMVFKKEALRDISFDRNYKLAEDWKFVYECTYKNKNKISIVPSVLVEYTHHKNGETIKGTDNFKYYFKLLRQIPVKFRQDFGIKLFSIYTNFVAWKNKKNEK